MTDLTRPLLDHAPSCRRKAAPILRHTWGGRPEVFCPDCGRSAPADINHNENDKETRR